MRQAIVAVEVLGHLAEGVGFGEQVALVVVTRSPGAAIRVADLGHQRGQVVIFVGDLAAQRVGFFEQAGEFVVLEGQAIAVWQVEADHVAVIVLRDGMRLPANLRPPLMRLILVLDINHFSVDKGVGPTAGLVAPTKSHTFKEPD